MRKSAYKLALALLCFGTVAGMAQPARPAPANSAQVNSADDSLLRTFLHDFDLPAATAQADHRLHLHPRDATALFVRMEAAELQERQDVVLDSALRLCRLQAARELHEIAASRVLQHAANTQAFNAVRRRVAMVAALHNACAFNLRLALVAAASDGAPIDLDQATHATNLLTRWRIAGPFGRYNNVDFERSWPPEADQLSRAQYSLDQGGVDQRVHWPGARDPGTAPETKPTGEKTKSIAAIPPLRTERFWFRDGMVTLPEYMSAPGIYYGAADVELVHSQMSRIEVLCSGTYSVLVDGKLALLQDARHATQANRASSTLHLTAGHHRVLLKFTADAAPFSISLRPQPDVSATASSGLPLALRQYILPLSAYFHGDLVDMAQWIEAAPPAGTTQYLRALLYSTADEHSPRAAALWKALGTAQPSATMARLKVAESAAERGQADDVLRQDVSTLLAERPQSEDALALAFHLARDRFSRDRFSLDQQVHDQQTDAPALLGRLLEAHPSCTRLVEAIKFYDSLAEQDKARAIEQQLSTCAPESLPYARVLSDSGRHGEAAAYLQQVVARNPWHRPARRNLVEQLVLADRLSAARLQAAQLRSLAPNASGYTRLEKDPMLAQDSNSQRANGFTTGEEFYQPYRRDGTELVRKTAQRSFSGGTAVILLSDKAIELKQDGSVSVYIHRITRPLNKDGISQHGEISLPRGSDLLELRTLKRSGEIIEPELTRQKPTISMPALEPGDAIEEEFVLHYAEMDRLADDAASFTFGSFVAPVLYARLVLLAPSDASVRIREQSGPPVPLVGENHGVTIRIWERDNIAQTVPEPLVPDTSLLPVITVMANEQTVEGLRDELMEATRAGLHVHDSAFALALNEDESRSEAEKARRIYRFVTGKIESTGPDWVGNSAEDTLNNGQGSRTAVFLALARAAGLKAALIMARRIELGCSKSRELSCYTEPLVRLWLRSGETIDLDAESEALPFGIVPPWLEARDALLVPELGERDQPEIVTLVVKPAAEKSVAEADLSLHHGDLLARLHVRLGAARAQEVRSLLRNGSDHDRQAFLEQLAVRIFPGASAVTGTINSESAPEQALELALNCTVAQYVGHEAGTVDIDQLAPALGLRTTYARTSERLFPLYLDSLFFESTVFHLRLPPGVEARSLPADFTSHGEFGDYALRFVRMPEQLDIHRDFHIPIQVIAPEKYTAFARFARAIDEAERRRITLELTNSDH